MRHTRKKGEANKIALKRKLVQPTFSGPALTIKESSMYEKFLDSIESFIAGKIDPKNAKIITNAAGVVVKQCQNRINLMQLSYQIHRDTAKKLAFIDPAAQITSQY